jgi:hypothetical protein
MESDSRRMVNLFTIDILIVVREQRNLSLGRRDVND